MTREEAIEFGRRLGEDTARACGEVNAQGLNEEGRDRVQRAMAYAAWEFDGKPQDSSQSYHQEFAIHSSDIKSNAHRGGADWRPKKK